MYATRTFPVPVMPPLAEADDRDLAAALARGDAAAFEDFVEQYYRRVVGLAQRLLARDQGAEDVAQEVFLSALSSAGKFQGRSAAWTWLATITVNRCRSLQRRRWLFEKFLRAGPRESRPLVAPGDARAIREETAQAVRRAVQRLPPTYREVIVLRYLEELSVDDVADVLRIKRNAVEVRLTRARKLLEPSLGPLAKG